MSWEEYRADRFFREGVDKLLFPESIYNELDRKSAYERIMKRAHENLWSEWLNSNKSAKNDEQENEKQKNHRPHPETCISTIRQHVNRLIGWLKRK